MKRFLIFFLVAALVIGGAMGAALPLNKDAITPIKSDVLTEANRLAWVSIQTIGNATAGPMVATVNRILTTRNITNSSPVSLVTANFTHQPDYPRVLTVGTNASTSGYWKFTGTDAAGDAISEFINLSSASSGTGTKAFKTVTALEAQLTTGQSNKTFTVGVGSKLGLNTALEENTTLMASLDGTLDPISASTQSLTVLSQNTITLTTALDATKPVKVWYMV